MSKQSSKADRSRTLRAMQVVYLAVGFGLVTAFGELSMHAVLRFVFDRRPMYSQSVVWMTPLADVAVFLILATLLIVLTMAWKRLGSLAVVVTAMTFVGLMSLLFVERRFALWAMALLSLGVATQVGRMAAAHPDGFLRLARVGTGVSVMVVLLMAGLAEGRSQLMERRAENGLVTPPAGAPNVIFIILDTVRARTLGLYGYERETTPSMEGLSDRGVVFDRAIAPATWTVPSHASMFSSRWPSEVAPWLQSPDRTPPFPTLASALRDRGYRTGGFVANWYQLSRTKGFSYGFTHYDDHGYSLGQIARCSAMIQWLAQRRLILKWIGKYETLGRRRAPDISDSLLDWLQDDPGDRPFFAFLNYLDAHSPYLPKPPFDALYGPSVLDREPVVILELNRVLEVDEEVVRTETDAYDGGVAYLDDHLGRLFTELEARGALDNTVVIVSSDHGDELGEHGKWGHAESLHEEVVRVPLLIFGPGVPQGMRVFTPASMRNIPATIADLTGIHEPAFHGVSLARYWDSGRIEAVPDTAFSEYNGFLSLYTDEYHYLQGIRDRTEYLYNHRTDPLETEDLASSPDLRLTLDSIRAVLHRMRPPETADGKQQ